jgi:hypothetical protein
MQVVEITKADGTREAFAREKLLHSLRRAGASDSASERIAQEIEADLQDGAPTSAIYKSAFEKLKAYEHTAAPRYSLKRAVFALGPTGFPFEDFVAEIFRAHGYTAETRIMRDGACTVHEVDVVAEKDGRRIAAEIKFHNNPGLRSDVKTALYVHARSKDVAAHPSQADSGAHGPIDEWWLITNTKFTTQAEDYGMCSGLKMVSWSRPAPGNLQDLIESSGVHPVTCLTTLSQAEKRRLLDDNIVLCRSLRGHEATLRSIGFSEEKIQKTFEEVSSLCGGSEPSNIEIGELTA